MKKLIIILIFSSLILLDNSFAQAQAELDRACENARAEKLEPLRQRKIDECRDDKDNDPQWCEQFWADYGNGGKTGNQVRQRMFDSLPECVEAEKARRDVN